MRGSDPGRDFFRNLYCGPRLFHPAWSFSLDILNSLQRIHPVSFSLASKHGGLRSPVRRDKAPEKVLSCASATTTASSLHIAISRISWTSVLTSVIQS